MELWYAYAFATFMKKPYLYVREGQVDVQTRRSRPLADFGAISQDLRDKQGEPNTSAYAEHKAKFATESARTATHPGVVAHGL